MSGLGEFATPPIKRGVENTESEASEVGESMQAANDKILAVEAKNIRLSVGKKAEQGNRIENSGIPEHNCQLEKKHCYQNKRVVTDGTL